MLILLLPLAFFLIFLNLLHLNKRKKLGYGNGELILISSIGWMFILVALTEFLSLFQALNQLWLAISWTVIAILLLAVAYRSNWSNKSNKTHRSNKSNWSNWTNLPGFYRFLVINLLVILLVTLVFGLVFPPNNPDAMSYHLARVMHWIQNQSIAQYRTNIIPQDIYPPGAEYIATHAILLSGKNLFVNIIQWLSMVGCLLGVYLLTGLFGSGKKAQIIAVFFAATLPIGLLESNSAQNDVVAAFWLICFVYFFLRYTLKKDSRSIYIGAIAIGLGILTKATNYFYGASFLIMFFWLFKKEGFKKSAFNLLITSGIILLINSGFAIRNQLVFGTPLGDYSSISITNTSKSLGSLLVHLTNDFFYQILTSLSSINIIIKFIYIFIFNIFSFKNVDGGILSRTNFLNSASSGSEDSTANLMQFIIVNVSLLTLFFSGKKNRLLKIYELAIIFSIILLDFGIAWTQFNTRYFISFYLLQAPIVAWCLNRFKQQIVIKLFLTAILVIAYSCLIYNPGKPAKSLFADRNNQYFNLVYDPVYLKTNKIIAQIITQRHYKNIGLNFVEYYFEYPLWVYLKEDKVDDFRIEHIDVRNKTAETPLKPFKPDVIIICDYCFREAPEYHKKYEKWAKVMIKVPYFTIYGQ